MSRPLDEFWSAEDQEAADQAFHQVCSAISELTEDQQKAVHYLVGRIAEPLRKMDPKFSCIVELALTYLSTKAVAGHPL